MSGNLVDAVHTEAVGAADGDFRQALIGTHFLKLSLGRECCFKAPRSSDRSLDYIFVLLLR